MKKGGLVLILSYLAILADFISWVESLATTTVMDTIFVAPKVLEPFKTG